MCCFDCELMPKLQHIRVAGKHFADFEIPTKLVALWRSVLFSIVLYLSNVFLVLKKKEKL